MFRQKNIFTYGRYKRFRESFKKLDRQVLFLRNHFNSKVRRAPNGMPSFIR